MELLAIFHFENSWQKSGHANSTIEFPREQNASLSLFQIIETQ